MKIVDVSIKQPIFITMVMAGIVVIGLVSYNRIAVDLFPDISMPIVSITIAYPGVSPEEIETQVTKPVEDAVSSLNGVVSIRSTSSEGVSVVVIEFKLEADPNLAATQVRDKVTSLRTSLPREVMDPVIEKFDPSSTPIISFGVIATSNTLSAQQLRTIVEEDIKPSIERVDGVASVELIGGREREIRVDVDLHKLKPRNLSILQVVQALRLENINLPAGRVSEGQHELLIRTQGEFTCIDEIGATIIAVTGGVPVRLRDVAVVRDGLKDQRSISRLNGQDCVMFSVRKQSGANTVKVGEQVYACVKELSARLPSVSLVVSADDSEFIREAKDDVILSLFLGAVCASIVVLLSFGDFRNTLVTIAGLPVCVIGAFAVIYVLGFSLNIITLLALSLSIGLLIDDAIVVRENIFRHVDELKKDPMIASSEGTAEVGLAVTATTLTIVAVFMPVAFATGIAGKFFREFGVTVTAAVLISLLEAFTFAPMLSAYFFVRKERAGPTGHRGFHRFRSAYDLLNTVYQPLLQWSLRHRSVTIVTAVMFFFGSVSFVSLLGLGGSPRGERWEFNILLEYPPGSTLHEADRNTEAVEKILRSKKFVSDIFTVVGTADGGADQAVVHVRLIPGSVKPKQFQDDIRPIFEKIPGLKITFRDASSFSGAAASTLVQLPIVINVKGSDSQRLTSAADAIKDRIASVSGLVDVGTNLRASRPEARIIVNKEKSLQYGVSTAQLASVLRDFIGGDVAGKFHDRAHEIDIRVRLHEEDRSAISQLDDIVVPASHGTSVNLSQIAQVKIVSGSTQIHRQDRVRQIVVGGNVTHTRTLGEVADDVKTRIARMTLPSDITIDYGGQAKQMMESFQSLGLSLLLAIIFVYMVLASQFDSFTQPLTIMLALPLAVIGAFIALLLADKPFDTMAFIGLIMLMGLVTKNSILLIDYINQSRKKGMDRFTAIIVAGQKRLRPILMTSLAMILGMMPVAVNFGTSAEFRVSMAVTIIGGLISSTLLTLVVVPVVYTVIDDAESKVFRRSFDKEHSD